MAVVVHAIELGATGSAPRSGNLTWAQQDIWDWLARNELLGPDQKLNLDALAVIRLDSGVHLDSCLERLAAVFRRHEILRTRFTVSPLGRARQTVGDDDVMRLHIADGSAAGIEDRVEELRRDLFTGIDLLTEHPIRLGLAVADGDVHAFVLVVSRIAVDGAGLRALVGEIEDAAYGVNRSTATPAQHLDQAGFQESERGRRLNDAAIRHWTTNLRPGMSASSVTSADAVEGAFRICRLRSIAARYGAEVLARALGTGTSSVFLAAFHGQVRRVAPEHPGYLRLHCGNRMNDAQRSAVGRYKQTGLFAPRPVYSDDFPAHVLETARASLQAYRHARYDVLELSNACKELERSAGVPLPPWISFNDRRGWSNPGVLSADECYDFEAARAASEFDDEELGGYTSEVPLDFKIDTVPGSDALLFQLETRDLSPQQARTFLGNFEDVIIAAAAASRQEPV